MFKSFSLQWHKNLNWLHGDRLQWINVSLENDKENESSNYSGIPPWLYIEYQIVDNSKFFCIKLFQLIGEGQMIE